MSWINAGQFQIADRNGRHYVFRRNNSGNTEINIPASVTTKAQAKRWLRNNPNKVQNPTKFRPKKKEGALKPWEHLSPGGKKYVKIGNKMFPAPKNAPKKVVPYMWKSPAAPQLPAGVQAWRFPAPKPFNAAAWKKPRANFAFNLPCDRLKASLSEFEAIGSGRQGKVYKAAQGPLGEFVIKVAPYDMAAKNRGEPQPFQVEFDIHSAVYGAVPGGVVKVYKAWRCVDFVQPADLNMKNVQNASYDKSRQGLIAMEYCDGGSLTDWVRKNPLSDSILKRLISQVVETLVEIRKKFPHFSHNDLHMQNIFVSKKRGFLIGDFGWARTRESGTNPAVNSANGTKTASFWGVGPRTDPRYDVHFFLNDLREWIKNHEPSKYPKAVAFLDRSVPPGYRGVADTHVSEWRLKYGDPCPGLATLGTIAKDPFLKGGFNSANLVAARGRLRKVKKPSPKKL